MEVFPDLTKYNVIHFIGIGGVSMSSLAMLLKAKNKTVTGSDSVKSLNTDKLSNSGIKVYIGHNAEQAKGVELIVYTAAISDNNPELVFAKENGIPMIERAVLLGMLMETHKKSIAISGTHGKTTTTSMLSSVFLSAGLDPTILIGARFDQIDGNYKSGNSDYAIYEACEYVNSFHHFYPETAIILNIDKDHIDYFKNLENIKSSFLRFTENVSENGYIVINGDDVNCEYILNNCNKRIITFGLSQKNDCRACNIRFENGHPIFDVQYKDITIKDIRLAVLGNHNILNALATVAVSLIYNVGEDAIRKGLLNFSGASRRFEIVKKYNDADIIDDYAHHPTEIAATISAAKSAGYKKTIVIFQSHTYTRTKALLDDFAAELKKADKVILTDIYSAREINTVGANILELQNKIPRSEYISDFARIAEFIKKNAQKDEAYILMGAGNVNQIKDLI